jgi:hypothetical protein
MTCPVPTIGLPPTEDDIVRSDLRLRWLLAFHLAWQFPSLVLALTRAWAGTGLPTVGQQFLAIPAFSAAMCQACLLGLWVALSKAPWSMRLKWFVLGSTCLEVSLSVALGDSELLLAPSISAFSSALSAFGILLRKSRLRQLESWPERSGPEPLHVSIRDLMLATVAVALLVAATKGIGEYRPGVEWIRVVVVLGVYFSAVALAASWATLGIAWPFWRFVLVLAASAGFGLYLAFAFFAANNWSVYFILPSIVILYTSGLLASLLVVRTRGYRLVPLSSDMDANRAVLGDLAIDPSPRTVGAPSCNEEGSSPGNPSSSGYRRGE